MSASAPSSRNQLRAVFAVIAITLALTVAGLFWARAKVRMMNGRNAPVTAPSSPEGAGP